MAAPTRQYDAEAMFAYWYNDGERRTLMATAAQFGCGYDTVKKYASEDDWDGRAEEIDAATILQINKQLASTRARRVVRSVRILDAVETKFLKRLDENDPAALTSGDVSIGDVLKIAELRDKLLGGVTHRFGNEGGADAMSLQDIESEIERLNMKELEEGGADG